MLILSVKNRCLSPVIPVINYKMNEYIFSDIQKKKFKSIGVYSQWFGIFILVSSLWAFLGGIFLLREGGQSLFSAKPIGRAIGFIYCAVTGFILGVYNLRMSRKFKMIGNEEDFNNLMKSIEDIYVIYKIYWIQVILATLLIAPAFLWWGITSLIR